MAKVTVYAEKYETCTLLGNMRIMPQSHKTGMPNIPTHNVLNITTDGNMKYTVT